MSHTHSHAENFDRAFAVGIALNVLFVLVEAFYGWMADSLALLSDAGHNLSDVLGLLLAWGGYYLARLRPSRSHTYGFGRATIMAALFNALLLLVAVGGIAWEAFDRFAHPVEIQGMTVIVVAAIGVLVNGVTAWLFMSGNHHDLNLRGAFLHMAADALVSVGVVAAGALFLLTGWYWLDPFISLIIALVILMGTWGLLRQALHLSLDGVPLSVELEQVRDYLTGLPEVSAVHDLHVWAMSTSEVALTVHLVMPQERAGDEFLCNVTQALHEQFGIEHATIQIESNSESCALTHHT
ncbi:MAG: cation diffusion facilitator family transporter [Gammaproteobacteria bacterium]|nr:cation diffusion facilitator family transporter [Gammaproteobacteria bacterium]MBU1623906.1 cation diffusion facilitator family transporter [Gammaproteobacteria bacterium]MBU1982123.1 cation diffusion facilitator family transporter [Gammaproteobacteria bacterium]